MFSMEEVRKRDLTVVVGDWHLYPQEDLCFWRRLADLPNL